MKVLYRFGILGADKRMKALETALINDGYLASMLSASSDFSGFDVLVLAPGCDFKAISHKCAGKIVFAPNSSDGFINYLLLDEFKRQNAVPSAEGAVYALMGKTEHTISGMDIGVVGAGCIGCALRSILQGMGAYVTVYARGQKPGTREIAELEKSRHTAIFNTVPAPVIDAKILTSFTRKPIIIDLASRPGGVDFAAAELVGIDCEHILGIPGSYAPKTAGEILKNTVLCYLRGVK